MISDPRPSGWRPFYIDGVKHMGEDVGNGVYADSESLPFRRCSFHRIGGEGIGHLRNGGAVRTLGSTYSFVAPLPPAKPIEPTNYVFGSKLPSRTAAEHVAPAPLHPPTPLPSMYTEEQVRARIRKVAFRLIAVVLFIETVRYVVT